MTITEFLEQTPPFPAGGRQILVKRHDNQHSTGPQWMVMLSVRVECPVEEEFASAWGETLNEAFASAWDALCCRTTP